MTLTTANPNKLSLCISSKALRYSTGRLFTLARLLMTALPVTMTDRFLFNTADDLDKESQLHH